MQRSKPNGHIRPSRSSPIQERWARLPVRLQGIAILAIPIVCLTTSLGTLGWLQFDMVEDAALVQSAQQVNAETTRLLTGLAETQRGVQSYALTENQRYLEIYQAATLEMDQALRELEQLVSDNPQQRAQIQTIRQLTEQSLTLMANVLAEIGATDPSAILSNWLDESEAISNQAELKLKQFASEEQRIFDQHRRHLEQHQRAGVVLVGVFALVGTIAALLAAQLFFRLDRELAKRQTHLECLNRQLQQTNEQLQRFAANASHELRTPLAAVLSNAQVGLMASPEDSVQPRQRLTKIAELAKSMSTLVGRLLFLAHHQSSLAPEELMMIDLVELLQALAESYAERVSGKNLQFTYQFPCHSITLAAQPDLLKQAVFNLLENAYRYTPADGYITLRLVPKPQGVLILVEDSGIGIPPESLPKIFEQFYRVEQTQSQADKGFGLGLAIVQQIVQKHGGVISATSILGKGATFQIELPLTGAV